MEGFNMWQWILAHLPGGAALVSLIPVIVIFNVCISALSKALDEVKDVIPGDLDNQIAVGLHKLLDLLKKILDFVGANPKH